MNGQESALVVVVPEAEPLVREWRLRHDTSAAVGVPAHITILFPFVAPSRLDGALVSAVAALVAAAPGFAFRLVETRRFGDEVLYLAPEPSEPFSRLTAAVSGRFDVPPYGGEIDDPRPHLTVADRGGVATLDAVDAAIAPELPIEARAEEVVLLVRGDDGRWCGTRRFPLGSA